MDNAKEIATALGLELYLGPPRDLDPPAAVDPDQDDFVAVTRSAARAAAGHGHLNGDDLLDPLLFRRDWLKKVGVTPSAALLLNVDGDSMFPIIRDGDLVMIDTTRVLPPVRPKPSGGFQSRIYVLDVDGETRVKYVERRAEDKVLVYSENASVFAPDVYSGAEIKRLNIRGKVVWWAHTVDDLARALRPR